MKKFLCFFFCVVLLASAAGCSGQPVAETDTSSVSQATDTEKADKSSSSAKLPGPPVNAASPTDPNAVVYDKDMEHKIMVTDVKKGSIAILDLNKCTAWKDITKRKSVVWEWNPYGAKNIRWPNYVGNGIDEAKYRYSEYYKSDVILACSSYGWAAVIKYPERNVLWEALVPDGPHSIEMLPNGDVVVASSGGDLWQTKGMLFYYPLSSGSDSVYSTLQIPFAHGVQWDPQKECLWVVQMNGVVGVKVNGLGTKEGTLSVIEGTEVNFRMDSAGHDLSPMYGNPGKYWVTGQNDLWLFDTEALTLTKEYEYRKNYTGKSIKGIAYFPDGTMVRTLTGSDPNASADCFTTALSFITLSTAAKDPSIVNASRWDVRFEDREFYKVRTFCKDYQ